MFSVIITDYKSIPRTFHFIETLMKAVSNNLDIIIVDNSGQHDGINYIVNHNLNYQKSCFYQKDIYTFEYYTQTIVLIDADHNGGYAKGNNLGAKLSDQLYDNKYYIFCNTDLEFPSKINLELLKGLMEVNPSVAIIGPNIVDSEGRKQNPRLNKSFHSQMILWDFNYLWFKCKFNKWLWNLDTEYHEKFADWVSGSFMVVSQKAFLEVDGFDESTFLYAEEMIICEKMRRRGYQTLYCPQITIIHHHRGTPTRYLRKICHSSKKYYYRQYKNANLLQCWISDATFFICETGYYLWHDCIKNTLKKRWKQK